MSLHIKAAQLYETGAATFYMAVLLPIANHCRARYSRATTWYAFHFKENESTFHREFFLAILVLGSAAAAACWALALAAYHRGIPEHAAPQCYVACHASLVLVATGFETYEVGWPVALCLDHTMRQKSFLPSRPGRFSLYIVFSIVTIVAIAVFIMVITLENSLLCLTLIGAFLLFARAYTCVLAWVLWRSCRRLNRGRASEDDAKTTVVHNSAIFVLSLLFLVLERKLWPTHVGAQYLLSMWYPIRSILTRLLATTTSLLRHQYAERLE